jgi:hypothetical protein
LLANYQGDLMQASNAIKHHNEGAFASWADYAKYDVEGSYSCDPFLKTYIDYQTMGDDIHRETSCLVLTLSDGSLHLIKNH